MNCQDIELWVVANAYVGEDTPKGPTPVEAGLNEMLMYRVIDIAHDTEDESETYLMVVNGQGEIWSISNRHLRVEEVTNREGMPRRVYRRLPQDTYGVIE